MSLQENKVTYYLLTECAKHLLSRLSIYLDGRDGTLVEVIRYTGIKILIPV